MKTDVVKLSPLPAAPEGGRARAPALASAPVAREPSAAVDEALARAAQQFDRADKAAAEANRRLAEKGSELTIEFDDALDRMVFRLVDSQTGEVVRQIPSEEVLAIARALAEENTAGVMLRTNA